jgi:hypothetical protein
LQLVVLPFAVASIALNAVVAGTPADIPSIPSLISQSVDEDSH